MSASPFQLPPELADAPEASLPPRAATPLPASEVDPFEAPTIDAGVDTEVDEDEPTPRPAAEIPHGGDVDFADAETQMDEYHGSDAFDDPGLLEDDAPSAAPSFSAPPMGRPSPDPDLPSMPPIAGLTTDDDYGGFTGVENPPTEEVELYQGVAQRHSAPMNVPEPPPIPGIEDRFTPPPVERTEMGSRHKDSRPSYLATPTPAASDREMFPTKDRRDPSGGLISMGSNRIPDDDEDDREEGPGMLRYVVAGLAVIAVVGVCGGGAVLVGMMAGGGGEGSAVQTADEHHGVKVERGIKKDSPEYVGEVDKDRPQPKVEDTDTPEDPDGTAEPADGADPGVPAVPQPTEAPAPAATPKPPPKPQPKAQPKPEPAAVSKLKIRANRRVLVYVDGKAVGYTPLDYQTGPGGHEVVAMISGKPESRQTKSASIAKAGDTTTVEFSF